MSDRPSIKVEQVSPCESCPLAKHSEGGSMSIASTGSWADGFHRYFGAVLRLAEERADGSIRAISKGFVSDKNAEEIQAAFDECQQPKRLAEGRNFLKKGCPAVDALRLDMPSCDQGRGSRTENFLPSDGIIVHSTEEVPDSMAAARSL